MIDFVNDHLVIISYLTGGVLVANFVLHGIGLFSLSKRRNLPHPWLAWIPFLNDFQLGCVADHFRLAKRGIKGKKRWITLPLMCINLLLGVISCLLLIVLAGGVAIGLLTFGLLFLDADFTAMLEAVAEVWGYSMGILICAQIPYFVVKIFLWFDVYRSCKPELSGLYLVLGIVFPFLNPLFVFLLRKDDEGIVVCEEKQLLSDAAE